MFVCSFLAFKTKITFTEIVYLNANFLMYICRSDRKISNLLHRGDGILNTIGMFQQFLNSQLLPTVKLHGI